MHLSQNALTVLRRRYLRKKGSTYETPEELFSRVAKDIASCEELPKKKKEELVESYTNMMANLEFLPNTPTLVNAGTGNGCSYPACFVLDVQDSLDDIFSTYRKAALIQKAGGGVGMDWSNIRPRDTIIKSTGYKTRGVVQFIKIYADAINIFMLFAILLFIAPFLIETKTIENISVSMFIAILIGLIISYTAWRLSNF